jgi:hypothetical protein
MPATGVPSALDPGLGDGSTGGGGTGDGAGAGVGLGVGLGVEGVDVADWMVVTTEAWLFAGWMSCSSAATLAVVLMLPATVGFATTLTWADAPGVSDPS